MWESDSLGGPRGQIAVFHSVGLSPEACGTRGVTAELTKDGQHRDEVFA